MEKMSTEQLSKSYAESSKKFQEYVKTMADAHIKDQFLNGPVRRVFISVPMSGRTFSEVTNDIEEAENAFLNFFGLDRNNQTCFEFVNTFVQEKAPNECRNARIWYLGNSIKVLSTCDIILFARGWYRARGCEIEDNVASAYYIPTIHIYERRKEDISDFEYVDGQLSLFVPEKDEKEETKPKYMTEEAYKKWRKVMDEEDRKEWQKVMNEVDGIGQR